MSTITELYAKPKSLSPNQREEMKEGFWDWFGTDREQDMEVLSALQSYFGSASVDGDIQFTDTYLFWFTMLFWKYITTRTKEDLIAFVPRTFAVAAFNNVDVKEDLLQYMQIVIGLPEPVETFYSSLREQILSSDAVIGTMRSAPYHAKDLVAHIEEQGGMSKGDLILWYVDNIDISGLFDPEVHTGERREASEQIVELLSFCLLVPRAFIWHYVDTLGHPEEATYREEHNMMGSVVDLEKTFASFVPDTPVVPASTQVPTAVPTQTTSMPSDVLLGSTESLRNTLEWLGSFGDKAEAWQALITQAKSLTPELTFESANQIMQLTFFLKQNGYETMPDIVYYNQTDNTFHWSDQ